MNYKNVLLKKKRNKIRKEKERIWKEVLEEVKRVVNDIRD